jgi:predicted nucleic acid-binding protein
MNADIVISGDKDFFEIKYPGLEVLTPKQFIKKYSM